MLFLEIFLPIVIFVLGVCLASFGNVLILRYPNWKFSGETRYSECPKCHHRLAWYDLFPIFSYLFLGGKCRYCKEKISPQYIIVELSGGLIFLLTYFLYAYCYHQGNNLTMDISFGFDLSLTSIVNVFCISIALFLTMLGAFIDKKHKEIPLSFSIIIFALAIFNWAVDFIVTKDYQLNYLLGLVIPFVLFGLIYLLGVLALKAEPIGLGDVILYCALGFLMGALQFAVILLFSTLLCSIVEVIKIKKTGKKEQIPLAPYIFVGLIVSVFVGQLIVSGYLALIGVN